MTDDYVEGQTACCELARLKCPKAARRWYARLGMPIPERRWIVDRQVFRERMKALSEGRLDQLLKALGIRVPKTLKRHKKLCKHLNYPKLPHDLPT
jgi:hypothetical protein